MRIAYVISAYKLPAQLGRLIRRLSAPGNVFYVHVDRNTPARIYDEMVAHARGLDVTFLGRHGSTWGGFGHVRASLKGIEELIRAGIANDYVVLLTGQDYPLRLPGRIAAALEAAEGRSFMSWWSLPHRSWGTRGGLDRIEDWHFVTRRRHLSLPLRRRLPGGLRPYGGAAYWCLSRPVVEHVDRFVRANPAFVRFFEHVFVPDELFFQTIVMNSDLRGTVENTSRRYVDWSREPAPAVLVCSDLEAMLASDRLFARKFDETLDAEVLDRLDEHLDRGAQMGKL